MIRRLSQDETGSALITALLATVLMLGLGFALLSIVDTQANESTKERSSDRAFNLSETLLTSEAFVLGRNWPTSAPATPCSTTGVFSDQLGNTGAASAAVTRLRRNLDASYNPAVDLAYTGAVWQVKLCDDIDPDGAGPIAGSTVWDDALLTKQNADVNANGKLWVIAQSTVEGRTRAVVGLVRARTTPALNSRYGLVAGGLADDLGATLNAITNQGVLGKTLHNPPLGLLDTTPTVASDPTPGAATPNGITGVRCGALDLKDGSTCVIGTLGAAGAIPLVSDLVTGGKIENVSGTTSASDDTIARLRAQARASGTYTAVSAGSAPVASTSPLNPNDTAPSSVAACTITGTPSASTVVFIEQVGGGTPSTVGGPGDQYCSIDVATTKDWKAIVVASGRVVIRGNVPPGVVTPASDTTKNTFKGVVYALNLQRSVTAIGDAAAPGREVVRIDRGAHVRGAVNADGKSAKVGIYPPPITISSAVLVSGLLCPGPFCATSGVITALASTLGLTCVVDALVNGYCLVPGLFGGCTLALPPLTQTAVAGGILAQATPQRTAYGSAITANVAAIKALTIYGDSNVVPGSFRDLQAR
jgi:Tfp pilus assembly protein PilX